MRLQTDTKALVLAALQDGPTHGYAVAKVVRETSQGRLKLGEGQLYPALHALEEAGWVTADWDDSAGDLPKRVYAITPAGRTELERRAADWHSFANAVAQILPQSKLALEAE